MAFGFEPKYKQQVALDELSPLQFLVVVKEAMARLDWTVTATSAKSVIAHVGMSLSSFGEEIEVTVTDSLANIQSKCSGKQVLDYGKNKRNVHSLLAMIEEVKPQVAASGFQESVIEQQQEPVEVYEHQSAEPEAGTFARLFMPRKDYLVTPIMIYINVLVFAMMIFSGVHFMTPDPESLVRWGANFRPSTLDGGFYRLLTSCFLHIGIVHLLLNMYALLYVGLMLEPIIGSLRFLAAYLLTGIAASATSLWWNEYTVSAGASGAIFGMYGVFLALLMNKILEAHTRVALLSSVGIFVGYNLLVGLRGEQVDNAAHIGGLVTGFAIGLAYARNIMNVPSRSSRLMNIGIVSIVVISATLLLYRSTTNDLPKYDEYLKDFARKEALALEVFQLPADTPEEEILFQLQDRGLYYWEENIQLLQNADRLSLPDVLHDRIKELLNYCKLRKSSYELMIKAIEEDTDKYDAQIEQKNRELEQVIKTLSEKS